MYQYFVVLYSQTEKLYGASWTTPLTRNWGTAVPAIHSTCHFAVSHLISLHSEWLTSLVFSHIALFACTTFSNCSSVLCLISIDFPHNLEFTQVPDGLWDLFSFSCLPNVSSTGAPLATLSALSLSWMSSFCTWSLVSVCIVVACSVPGYTHRFCCTSMFFPLGLTPGELLNYFSS